MDVRKEIIRPGSYTYINPETGLPERLNVTPDTIRHFHAQGEAMLASGLSIPVPLEHQPDARPQTEAERAAHQLVNNAGFVKKYELATVKDDVTGKSEERLFSVLDIPDPKIYDKLPKTIRSVSPWINSFTDGAGKKWEGVISHVALTTRPRIAKQANFETISSALSTSGMQAERKFSVDALPSDGVCLSRMGRLDRNAAGSLSPAFPIGFSMMTGIPVDVSAKFGTDEEVDEIEDEDEVDEIEADDDGGEPVEGATEVVENGPVSDQMPETGDVSFEELIPHLLEMHGISIPPGGGKGKDFLKALVRGLLASAKSLAATDGGEDDSVLGDNGKTPQKTDPAGPIMQESPPMYMSLTTEKIKGIKDPEKRQMAQAFLSLQRETAALRKNKLDEASAIRQRRVEKLSRRIPIAARDKLLQAMSSPSAKLSLGSDGVVVDPMAQVLEIFETGIPDITGQQFNGVKLSEENQPIDGTISDSRAEQLANGLLGRRGAVSE